MKKSYPAIIFRQRPGAPLQVAFAAPSAEIDGWARVPTKRTGNIRNFQRAEVEKHSLEIGKFFADQSNSSPTAVVVGFDPIRSEGKVVAKAGTGQPLTDDAVIAGRPDVGSIEIEWGDPADAIDRSAQIRAIVAETEKIRRFIYTELKEITRVDDTRIETVWRYLLERVKGGYDPDLGTGEVGSGESDINESDDDDEKTNSADDVALEDDAPDAVIASLAGLSPSERQVLIGRLAFLASLEESVLETRTDQAVAEAYQMVLDELKPALLIDGQHRVMGTKKLGNIPFLVTALPRAPWSELAFQFIVTNRTARRVPESLLISIIGNSLSKLQREQIETRLHEAGIRVGLIEAVMKIHEDEQSPFYGYLAFGLKNERGFLDAAAMRSKVVQPWYERQGAVAYLFDHFCQGKRKTERTEYWKSEEVWLDYFAAFWSAVKARYEGSAVFSPEVDAMRKPTSKLMTATVLMIFQHVILNHLERLYKDLDNAQNIPVSAQLKDAASFQEMVRNTLQKLTPDFFVEWQITGFDGSRGARDDLAEAIRLVIQGKKTVAQLKDKKGRNPHRLFKEKFA